MNRALFLIIIGLGGAAILVSLGVWQVQRLAWKEGVIADIDARIVAPPVALPAQPDPVGDNYLPVKVTGQISADYLRVLVSQKDVGAGYRVISTLDHEDGPILLDRGFIEVSRFNPVDFIGPIETVEVVGNLQWPDETDGFTPAPDLEEELWFARDVDAMAQALGARPILLVASSTSPQISGKPLPVDTSKIPNNHLQYAITWFSLAALWLAMSVLFLLRRRAAPPSESK